MKTRVKNTAVCNNNPWFVGQPLSSETSTIDPRKFCTNLYNNGDDTKKNIIDV